MATSITSQVRAFGALSLLAAICLLASLSKANEGAGSSSQFQVYDINQVEWWKKTNYYHIYLRSFKDSTGDGNGDLRGVIEKLDYLKEIGVETILMAPFYSSPMKDCGYDIDNYLEINPMFGSMQDFDDLMSELKKRQMRMVVDFVPNHSSNKHYWFWCSERAFVKEHMDECWKYKDYYVWNASKRFNNSYPTNWNSVFGGGPAWTWSEVRKEFYLHHFLPEQPDMNFRNPAVREEFKEIARFWYRKGADGLRIDAPLLLIEDTIDFKDNPVNPDWKKGVDEPYFKVHPIYVFGLPESAEILKDWRDVGFEPEFAGQQKLVVSEAYHKNLDILLDFHGRAVDNRFADAPFNFQLIKLTEENMKPRFIEELAVDWIRRARDFNWPDEHGAMAPWIIWVQGTHDNIRTSNQVGEHNLAIYQWLAYFLPGCPANYNGDELGIRNSDFDAIPQSTIEEGEPTRLIFRAPMAWSPAAPWGGFTTNPKIWLPLNDNYETHNVHTMMTSRGKPFNTLQLFMQLQSLRKEHLNTFVFGDAVFFENEGNDQILALGRPHPKFGSLLMLANLDKDNKQRVKLAPADSVVRRVRIAPPTSGLILMANYETRGCPIRQCLGLENGIERGNSISLDGIVLGPSQAIIVQY
uniref:alpha-glucosidase n=1 Tax=Aceria tosichella TaxID=561515 RepID=A0A6G1S7K6_9ACAR